MPTSDLALPQLVMKRVGLGWVHCVSRLILNKLKGDPELDLDPSGPEKRAYTQTQIEAGFTLKGHTVGLKK